MLQDYPKLSQAYYALLECLAQDHISFLSKLEPQVFVYILTTISEGLTSLGECRCAGHNVIVKKYSACLNKLPENLHLMHSYRTVVLHSEVCMSAFRRFTP